jgi:hypothetical protein
MIQEGNIYTAEEGKLIVRISDDFIMGPSIDLGSADNIDNYEERSFSQEEMNNFWDSVGMPEMKKIEIVEE